MIARRLVMKGFSVGALSLATGGIAFSQDKSPITILVGSGTAVEATARLIAEEIRVALGRPVVVERKFGAGQRLALGILKRSPPDGSTLMFTTSGPFAIYPNIYTNLDYDPVADFTVIAGAATFDVAVATNVQSGITDIPQLVAWIKSQPKGVPYGTQPGNGSGSHFVGIEMALSLGVKLDPVFYNDGGSGVLDLIGGRLPLMITGINALADLHKAGKIRVLAVSGEQRSPFAPDVPTLKEAGIDVSMRNFAQLIGPAKLPVEFVERVSGILMAMLARADVRERVGSLGITASYMPGAQLSTVLQDERKHIEQLVKASGYVRETL